MQLHQRGVDLLVDVMDAIDQVEQFTHDEIRRLLQEAADVMSLILERDANNLRNTQNEPAGVDRRGNRQKVHRQAADRPVPADARSPQTEVR